MITPFYFDIKKESNLIAKEAQRLGDVEIYVDRKIVFQIFKYRQYLIDQINLDEDVVTNLQVRTRASWLKIRTMNSTMPC